MTTIRSSRGGPWEPTATTEPDKRRGGPWEPTATTAPDKRTALTAEAGYETKQASEYETADTHYASTVYQSPTLGAYGCTIVLAPQWSLRLGAEDNVLITSFVRTDMALLLQTEIQTRSWIDVLPSLCADARRVYEEDNAGGSSLISESLSMEVLARTFGAKLHKTEMQLAYWPAHSAMTDFSVEFDGVSLGVSVTRALAHPTAPLEVADALRLLQKKLSGVLKSTAACYNAEWRKQILHIWARSERVVRVLEEAYSLLEPHLIANTLCLVTHCGSLPELFEEKSTIRQMPPPRLKGAKDEQHLKVLAESDPTSAARTRAGSW